MFFKRKNKQPPASKIVGGSGSGITITDPKTEIMDGVYSELDSQNLFLKNGCDLQRHIYNNCRNLLVDSDKIFVSFRFDWESYKSDIVLTGRKYKDGCIVKSAEELLRTPQIPLIGGCWSNVVAMRMLQGQADFPKIPRKSPSCWLTRRSSCKKQSTI